MTAGLPIAVRHCSEGRAGANWGAVEPEFAELGPGPIPDVLIEYSDEVGAAVLVVGSTGHGLLGRLAPGRTVQRLLPLAHCPVAIAPRGYRHISSALNPSPPNLMPPNPPLASLMSPDSPPPNPSALSQGARAASAAIWPTCRIGPTCWASDRAATG
ncbi:MAG: universal stress protein [Pseudonocardiales bacterium]|nr:universal stress protein [Pseudonocardiales bacterium]